MWLTGSRGEWISWLRDNSALGGSTAVDGFDVQGCEDSTWVLHSIYETLELTPSEWLQVGWQPESWAGEEMAFFTNFAPPPLGNLDRIDWASGAAEQWPKLKATLCGRFEALLIAHWCFPGGFADEQIPPTEGFIDEEALGGVVDVISAWSSQGRSSDVLAFYSDLATKTTRGSWRPIPEPGANYMFEGRLADLRELVGAPWGFERPPSNIWAADGSWFMWTPDEAIATKVSGPRSLIDAIRNCGDIEHLDEFGWQDV